MTCKSMVVVQWTFRENGAHQRIYTALVNVRICNDEMCFKVTF